MINILAAIAVSLASLQRDLARLESKDRLDAADRVALSGVGREIAAAMMTISALLLDHANGIPASLDLQAPTVH